MEGRRPAEEGVDDELIVHDEPHDCPYLPGRQMRAPLRMPVDFLSEAAFDARLRAGDRRIGPFLYRTECPGCVACEPIRVDANAFEPSASQRRVLRHGDARFRIAIEEPSYTPEKFLLYERHKLLRGLAREGESHEPSSYEGAFARSCVGTFELQIRDRDDDRLVALSILDCGHEALSAVYCFWDPRDAASSPGTYAILRELLMCRDAGWRWLYLGLYVEGCRPMRYKARYVPHERLIGGRWVRFVQSPPRGGARCTRRADCGD